MRLFERCIYKNEIADVIYHSIDSEQYAYKVGHNSTMALIKCQHTWLKGLDNGVKYVRVLSFDFSKAFDSVPHDILFGKVKKLPFNPYIINWMIDFLKDRKQRVTVDAITTEFLKINRGVPQGTVLGPILFSIMVNDIKPINPINELCKFADDITIEAPGYDKVGLTTKFL
jgi:retron-type reverse transcriptase